MPEPGHARPRRITRPDAVLRGHETGAGPAVLLLHAGGERRRVWTPVIEVLVEAGFRCVAFDLRGHGDSSGSARALAPCADDVAAMLHVEPPGCVVVGASLGGLAAVAALADPAVRARVAGLVLVDVVPDLDPGRVRGFLAAGGLLDEHAELVGDILAHVPRLRRVTTQLEQPVLLVRGGTGSPVTDDDAGRLLRQAPHAEVTRIRGAGHLVARDQPVALAGTIAAATTEWPALALLRDLGAAQVSHPGGTLLDHLRRVSEQVTEWGGSRRARLAALCHATYGTDGFPHPLLPPDRRARLRAAIGDDAEELVHRYGACERSQTYARLGTAPLPLTDRFTGEVVDLTGTDLTDFALLTIANELDVARTASLTPGTRGAIRSLIATLGAYVPDVSRRAVADPSLA
ncbi:alpha/beta fold hydrolase [Amycolatopsis australiensis]|uniref:Alpha/beta hydrolase family protein n=1 Tax=Amycolatopsis australiensis TaxID=546364 RepID=A0A1K1SXA0_9PSEU|nr:alpha/beta fold hydrolase [Amycolatopsis australiensis]SFW88868.1 Alpha/beta hydrolase family protein [Amycolatopsis australiensis]